MNILWTIIIGLAAGVIAKLLYRRHEYEPSGFIIVKRRTRPAQVE
jgi:uncharacterized membrane protein YeaQ/YmgE (transglycosylase-associated protein family)